MLTPEAGLLGCAACPGSHEPSKRELSCTRNRGNGRRRWSRMDPDSAAFEHMTAEGCKRRPVDRPRHWGLESNPARSRPAAEETTERVVYGFSSV